MPPSPSAGLLAFLLALPSLALVVPPASEASVAAAPEAGAITEAPSTPADAMEARLRRLSEAIRARASALEEGQQGAPQDESWVAVGGWLNGNNRGWVNRGWPNRIQGSGYNRPPQVWANFRPGWRNFSNGPSFLNW
ncbi:MAG: GrrA/OscA1 family cyclophane-containing rSAM-modified RiPP [Cyanobacteriota bacterium]|jgi:rSAM-associated Gly-rich repeat protein